MNLYRVSIDSDIKSNGAINQFKLKKYPDISYKGRTGGVRQKFTAFSLNASQSRNPYENTRFSGAKGAYNNNVSFTPKPFNVARPQAGPNRFNTNNMNKNAHTEQKWDPRRKNVNINRNRFNINNQRELKNCSYCGMRGHKAQDCHNIVSDSGKRIELLPTQGTCTKCPSRISPRLHHPEALCPYRVGGPLNRNN
jgi:hypothetical protein